MERAARALNWTGSVRVRISPATSYRSFAIRTTGCRAVLIRSTIAFAPPRSAVPCRLSASSIRTRRRPVPKRLPVTADWPATRSIAARVRESEAFSSTTSQSISRASAYAAEVLPVPGLP